MTQDARSVHVGNLLFITEGERRVRWRLRSKADFAFLTTRGEVVDEESENTIKILVLTELATNCIGFVVATATDARKVKGQVCKWLDHFGLSSSTSSVVLHTDAERAVSELVGTSSEKYTFMVRRARPQQHQSNGGAERAVRRLRSHWLFFELR